ncbi:unnamed protein product [Prunus armeniaca]
MVERSQLVLQESASQLPPETPIESVDPPQDAGFQILTQTLDQTLGRSPGTYCRGMGNARQREPRPRSLSQANSQVTVLTSRVAELEGQMSVILQSLARSGIPILNFGAPTSEPVHPEHPQQTTAPVDAQTSEPHMADDQMSGSAEFSYVQSSMINMNFDRSVHCQSLVEELSASHSTDLKQRAYELQAVISLDAPAVESIMPSDASCEDIEIDKSLSFLNGYVQQALEKGAQPYIPDNERSGMLNISNFSNQDQHEALTHGLRFEAYELPKPAVPSRIPPAAVASSTELVPVPEPSYAREIRQPASLPPMSDAGSSELKLRLDGVQRKWGMPT